MITMDQIKAEKRRLAEMESKLMKLETVDRVDKILSGGDFLISVAPVEGSFASTPIQISLALTDSEQSVLAKSIQVVLEFAKQRMENELEGLA